MGSKNIYERFIWFDDRVKQKKYPNTTTISKQFEVSIKTAQRDIEFMRDRLNCPLFYDPGRKGYFYKDDTFSLPLIYLSLEELSSLLIARKFLQDISEKHIGDELSSVIQKITAILKKHMAEENLIDDALSFQLIQYSTAPEEIFKRVLEGCLQRKSLHFQYCSPAYEDATVRTVNPYHLLNYMGTWHLIAYCHTKKNLRNFVVGRMRDLKVLDATFSMPRDFHIKEYLQSAFGIYKGKAINQVTLRFSPIKAKRIVEQIWHKDQKVKYLKDGSLELTFPVANFAEIAMEILKHGSGVEVMKPKALRDIIKNEAKNILKIY